MKWNAKEPYDIPTTYSRLERLCESLTYQTNILLDRDIMVCEIKISKLQCPGPIFRIENLEDWPQAEHTVVYYSIA